MAETRHVSVLPREALAWLAVRPGGLYVDATFGAGGHSAALVAAGARVIAFDTDPTVRVPAELAGSVRLLHRNFAELEAGLDEAGAPLVDGVLFDLGISSLQLDSAERGFSFNADGPLDMRLDPGTGEGAREFLARAGERELATVLTEFGDERAARRIARAIVGARAAGRLPATTGELARLIAGAVHVAGRRERIHPATRTFQALRIAVNDELGALDRGLEAAVARTRAGGRIVAISFHSLEDRIVKRTFRDDARVRALTKKPVVPEESEIAGNARARSAKLRAAERLESAA